MHIPGYAHETIDTAIPEKLSAAQRDGRECTFCGTDFASSRRKPNSFAPDRDHLRACRYCLTDLSSKAREARNRAIADADRRAVAEKAELDYKRARYREAAQNLIEAAQAIRELIAYDDLQPRQAAELMISLESAMTWLMEDKATTTPEDYFAVELPLETEISETRRAVLELLVYSFINDDLPDETELCAEFDCEPDCDGRHPVEHIDTGPDAIFEDLANYGVYVRSEDHPDEIEAEKADSDGSLDIASITIDQLRDAHLNSHLANIDPMTLAVMSLALNLWRNTAVENAHAGNGLARISDGEMFAANVTMTRLVDTHLRRDPVDWAALEHDIVRPDRVIGNRTVADLLGELYEKWADTVHAKIGLLSGLATQRGHEWLILFQAIAGLWSVHRQWWGMPDWPATVDKFVAGLDEPTRPLPADQLRSALIGAPDSLAPEVLDWCVAQGIGNISLD